MNKEELIGKLQMVYVGDINALNELIGYYDGLKTIIVELQQENKQLREKVNKFNIDKINNENKSLKGSCKVLGEKNNNQRKELQRLNNKIEKLKVINEEHKKLNGELREENKQLKELIDTILNWNIFKNECPMNFGYDEETNEDKAQDVFYKDDDYCENNCNDDYTKCWLKYFKRMQELEKGDSND